MYSILIVEDEQIERESLVYVLSRSMLKLDHIYEAKDGIEALSLYVKYEPSIVLLDIHLPRLNGLECAKQIRKLAGNKDVRFIIQSSYDYFSYAQESIRLGVEDFVLKPAAPQKIISCVSKIIDTFQMEHNRYRQTSALLDKVDDMKKTLESECIQMILSNQNEILIQKLLSLLNMNVQSGFCIIAAHFELAESYQESMKNDIADLGYFSLMGNLENQFILFFLYAGTIDVTEINGIKDVLLKYQIFDYPLGVGSIALKIEDLYQSYYYASAYVQLRSITEFQLSEKYSNRKEDNEINCTLWADDILHLFEMQDDIRMQHEIRKFVEELLLLPAIKINSYIEDFITIIMQKLQSAYQLDFEDSMIEVFSVKEEDKYQNLEIRMIYTLNTILTPVKTSRYQNINHLAKRSLKFIKENYNKSISLNDVARELEVSPFYVSKLLNKQLNKTFTNLVNEFRIEQAKYLLKEHYMVKEIAGKIGYRSSGYFSKIFKNLVGVTPTEYRDIFL